MAQSVGRGWVEEPTDPEDADLLRRVRSETAITTYTVLGPFISAEDYPSTFGPHGDEVRTLP